jgi:hypothetical protein
LPPEERPWIDSGEFFLTAAVAALLYLKRCRWIGPWDGTWIGISKCFEFEKQGVFGNKLGERSDPIIPAIQDIVRIDGGFLANKVWWV